MGTASTTVPTATTGPATRSGTKASTTAYPARSPTPTARMRVAELRRPYRDDTQGEDRRQHHGAQHDRGPAARVLGDRPEDEAEREDAEDHHQGESASAQEARHGTHLPSSVPTVRLCDGPG